jgi:hypothetical protein
MIDVNLRTYLRDNQDFSSLVDENNIYPVHPPPNSTWPALAYSIENTAPDQVFAGVSLVRRHMVKMNCWARRYSEVRQISEFLVTHFNQFVGDLSGSTILYSSARIVATNQEQEIDLFRSIISIELIERS